MHYILDNLPDIILQVDKNLKVVWANMTAIDTMPDIIGQSCHEAYMGTKVPCRNCPTKRALQSGMLTKSIMHRPCTKWLKEESYWEEIAVPLKDKNDEITGIIEIARNITERQKAEIKLKESEVKFKTLASNIPGATYRYSFKTCLEMVFISNEIKKISGYASRDFINSKIRTYKSIIYPDDRKIHERIIINEIRNKKPYTIEYRIINKNGDIRWFFEKGQAIYDDTNNIKWIDGAIFDITARKRIEKELRITQFSVENSINPIIWTSNDGRIQFANNASCTRLGFKYAELLSMKISKIDLLLQQNEWDNYWKKLKRKGKLSLETNFKTRDGEVFPVEINATYINFAEREYNCLFVNDITERKKKDTEIKRSNQAQSAINNILKISLNDISMEQMLQRILNYIINTSWISLLRKGAIFLTNDNQDHLILKVSYNFPQVLLKTCNIVPFGKCICGKTALTAKAQFAESKYIDHKYIKRGLGAHSHYCVPILTSEGKVLGVINLYMKINHKCNKQEEQFLKTIANTLAGIILRKKAENKLREYQKDLEVLVVERTKDLKKTNSLINQIFENTASGIMLVDLNGNIVMANKTMEKISGLRIQEILKLKTHQVLKNKKYNMKYFIDSFTLDKINEIVYENSLRRMDKKKVTCLVHVRPFTDEKGDINNIIYDYRDITEKRRLEKKLLVSKKLAVLGNLAGSLSHELRNPLGVIKNAVYYLNMMGNGIDKDNKNEYLNLIKSQVSIADRIISSILDFVRPNDIQLKTESVNKIIDDLLLTIKIPSTIVVSKQYSYKSKIQIDPIRIAQVLNNIITNSIQAIEDEGKIFISTNSKKNIFKIIVRDDGSGMSEDDLGNVFEPLFSKKSRGVGLGLNIVKSIIEKHKGSIYIKSKVGVGTEVEIRLPIILQGGFSEQQNIVSR